MKTIIAGSRQIKRKFTVATNIVEERKQRIWKMSPSPERAKIRSKTYSGIAKAMADQWSKIF